MTKDGRGRENLYRGRPVTLGGPVRCYWTTNVVTTGRWSLGMTPFESRVS